MILLSVEGAHTSVTASQASSAKSSSAAGEAGQSRACPMRPQADYGGEPSSARNRIRGNLHRGRFSAPNSISHSRPVEALTDVWAPSTDNKIILELPATVEYALPNVHCRPDRVDCSHLSRRPLTTVSLH